MRINLMITALAALAASPARADLRTFSRTYDYATQPQGNLEAELWNDVLPPYTSGGATVGQRIVQRVELEYGVTDHLDVSLYHVFVWAPEASGFDGWRLEGRYRLSDKGVWPVDVELYLEGERPADLAEPFELEEKLILGKDFGRLGFALNLVAEEKLAGGVRAGQRGELDAGARYEVLPWLRVGFEASYLVHSEQYDPGAALYVGPGVSVAAGRLWLQLGVVTKVLGDAPGAVQLRSVLGFNL